MFKLFFLVLALICLSLNGVAAHPLSAMRRGDWDSVARNVVQREVAANAARTDTDASVLKARAAALPIRAKFGMRSWRNRAAVLTDFEPMMAI